MIIPEEYLNSMEVCRQFKNASIWPLNQNLYLGRFRYGCNKCGFESYVDKWLKILHPVDSYPEQLWEFIKPYSDYLKL